MINIILWILLYNFTYESNNEIFENKEILFKIDCL